LAQTKTHLEAIESFERGLVDIHATNTSLIARIPVKEPDSVVRVSDSETELRDSSAIVSVSEARVKAVDGLVRVMSGNTRSGKRRLGRGVVALSDYDEFDCLNDRRLKIKGKCLQLKRTVSPWLATTLAGWKTPMGLSVVLPPTVTTTVFAHAEATNATSY
jgi:hypothetical protein